MLIQQRWELLHKNIISENDYISYEDFLAIKKENPASALAKLDGIFLHMSFERMRQLAHINKVTPLPKSQFQLDQFKYAWKAIRAKYHCSLNEFKNANTFIQISEKKFTVNVTNQDVEDAWICIVYIFDRWQLNEKAPEDKKTGITQVNPTEIPPRINKVESSPAKNARKETELPKEEQRITIAKDDFQYNDSAKFVEKTSDLDTDESIEQNSKVEVIPEPIDEHVAIIETNEQTTSNSEEQTPIAKQKSLEHRFFSYLLELTQLREKVVRDYTKYEKHWDTAQLTKISGCFIEEKCADEETLFSVSRPTLSRDEQQPPKLPTALDQWVDFDIKDAEAIPQFKEKFERLDQQGYIHLEDDQDRLQFYKSYSKEWAVWATHLKKKRKQLALYNTFFELVSRFEKEGESLELIYGRGMFTWKQSDPKIGNIHSPLLLLKIELDLDAKNGIISAKITDDNYMINNEMFSGVRLPNIERVENIFRNLTLVDILTPDTSLFKEFIHTIHSQGKFFERGQQAITMSSIPAIFDESTIILRQKNTRVLRDDLTNIVASIEDETLELNDAIKSLIYQEVDQTSSETDRNDKNNLLYKRNELFFPLPANEQQVQIVERLKQNYGVTVQGPPGTGKTHTIANLVSHYLSLGKKVLITSQKENALKVLRDKIPADIRDLCVPVLGGGRESIQEIENSINTISEKLGELDFAVLNRNVNLNLDKLDESYRQEAALRTTLKQFAELEGATLQYKGEKYLRYEVAEKISDAKTNYAWIIDEVALNAEFPLSKVEFNKLWSYRQLVKSTDLQLEKTTLPVVNEHIKNGEAFEQFISAGQQHIAQRDDIDAIFEQYQLPKEQAKLTKIFEQVQLLDQHRGNIENSASQYILTELFAGGDRKQHWLNLIAFLNEQKDRAFNMQNALITHNFHLTEMNEEQLLVDLHVLKSRLASGKSIQSSMFNLFNRKLAYLVKEPVLNDAPIQKMEDIATIEAFIQYKRLKRKTANQYNRNMERFEKGFIDANSPDFPRDLEDQVKDLNLLMQLFNLMNELYESIQIEEHALLKNEHIANMKQAIEKAQNYIEHIAWLEEYNNDLAMIEQLKTETSHPILGELTFALENYQVERWHVLLAELQSLHETQYAVRHFSELVNKLKEVLPLTYNDIMQAFETADAFPEDYLDAFEMQKLQTWLDKTKDMNQEALHKQLSSEIDFQRKLKTEIVRDATWSSQLNSITDEQQRALSSWKSFIKRVGKGTGKYARQHLLDARKQMKIAQNAIPVWIMPITQVMENFPIYNEKFDVVIFDESSQCDIYAVNVLLRGKKMIVVGDDEQISPESIGTKQEDVNDLVNRYISDIPSARLFDGQISLYEIAEQIFPKEGKLMLREHFRCVPEIIHYSNDLSYGGEMIPLRLPLPEEKIDPPVMAIHVPDGFNLPQDKDINEPEANKIAEDILEIIQNPKLEQQTIGVISLQGAKQHKLLEQRIRAKIGDAEFVKRQIICGNPYDLQGDERDIICLSMVVAPNRSFRALTTGSFKQRYNVAASRARNQLRLYHSVTSSDLGTNDLRYGLLSYCQSPSRVPDKMEDILHLIESPFEKDVIQLILAKGYRVTPQVEVGKFRIDIVIEGLRNRLAVEVDGEKWHGPEKYEEDMERQAILERSGWKFWRIRGREFYLDRKNAMESLWALLDEMDIQPYELETSE